MRSTASKQIRFVVIVDIEAPSLTSAYLELHERLVSSRLDWESTDECYEDGVPVHDNTLQMARESVFALIESPLYKLAKVTQDD